ncbi:MAG: fatty acid desaturase family protein [Siculibacillus sp.]|nr:fatty acid desaturase family protein [Siculibacillus sp.]
MFFDVAAAVLAASIAHLVVALALDPSWTILPGLLLGWVVIDFCSGLVHMLLDFVPMPARMRMDLLYFARDRHSPEYRRLREEILGSVGPFWRIAFNFKYHHPRPNALGRRNLRELCADTLFFAALPWSLTLNVVVAVSPPPAWVIAAGVSTVIGALFIQYFHATLHRREPPAFVAAMRRLGLLMTPEAHQRHHDVQDNSFAIIAGWTNPPLDRIFRALVAAGLCRAENLEPPRSEATRHLATVRQRSIAMDGDD